MSIFNVISLLGGLALFLYGMRVMGDGLKKGSSATFKRAMEKVTNNPFVGFLLGALVTAIIQSSTATIVLASGLVAAGILTLHQSVGIIIGANVGTTITGQIIRLMDVNAGSSPVLKFFQPATLAPLAAIIGILLIAFIHFKNSDTIGSVAMGFGILFTGLLSMTAAVSDLSASGAFDSMFVTFSSKPFLGFLTGLAVSFILQSSSATIGIVQSISMTGMLTFHSVFPILLGIYLGDAATTTIVCSIGAKADPKRVGLIQLMYNISKILLIILIVLLLHQFGVIDQLWDTTLTSGGIANTSSVFNIACAILLLPATGLFEKFSKRVVKDDPVSGRKPALELASLDKAFYKSPALALSSANLVVSKMADMSSASVKEALDNLIESKDGAIALVIEDEDYLDEMADKTSGYLANLLPLIDIGRDNDELNYYLNCVNEFERIGDHAVNLTENAADLKEHGGAFSEGAKEELKIAGEVLHEILNYACEAFKGKNLMAARHIEPIEEVVDDLVAAMRENHLHRLRDGKFSIYTGFTFLDALVNIERIADQCSNIGVHTVTLLGQNEDLNPHNYIKDLHMGRDAFFNSEYERARERYLNRLSHVIQTEDGETAMEEV